MTALMIPASDRKFLRIVRDATATKSEQDWSPLEREIVLNSAQGIIERIQALHRSLERGLAEGAEASQFGSAYGNVLTGVDELLKEMRETIELVRQKGFLPLVAELEHVEQTAAAFRDFVVECLSLATAPPSELNWERLRAAEAAYQSGETKRFEGCR